MTLKGLFGDIANSIRNLYPETSTGRTAKIKATQFPLEIESAKTAISERALNDMWASITQNNKREVYDRGFSQWSIREETFRPPHTLRVGGVSSQMFYNAVLHESLPEYESRPIDAQKYEDETGRPMFDTSLATRLDYFNNPGVFSTLGVIDVTRCTTSVSLTQFCSTNTFVDYLRSIKKLLVSADTYFDTTMFRYCSGLTHCVFEGTIGKGGLNLSFCTSLDYESIMSIFRSLSSTTSGLTVTLSRTAVNKAFETSPGANDGTTSQDWNDFVASRSNWTISLA